MKTIRRHLPFIIPLFAFAAVLAIAGAEDKYYEFADSDGLPHTPLVLEEKKAIVLIFVSHTCPVSNALIPEINRLAAAYAENFAFYFVEAEAGITPAIVRKHRDTLEIKAPVLLDPEHRLAKLTKAKITPEAVVLEADGDILYKGRVNDLYTTPTKKLPEPTTNDLRDALDAIAAGKPVPHPATKAIGRTITIVD